MSQTTRTIGSAGVSTSMEDQLTPRVSSIPDAIPAFTISCSASFLVSDIGEFVKYDSVPSSDVSKVPNRLA
jgi:hypothetical protein